MVAVRKHRPMAVWGGRTTEDAERKLVLTLALILAFSPGEKEPPWRVLIFRLIVRPNQSRVFPKDGARFSFLSLAHRMGEGGRRPGEGLSLAGMREDVKPFKMSLVTSSPTKAAVLVLVY
jgi:hypothetical protein